jgi:hypothetical protein
VAVGPPLRKRKIDEWYTLRMPPKNESFQKSIADKLGTEFIKFIKDKNYSAAEMRQAYELFLEGKKRRKRAMSAFVGF